MIYKHCKRIPTSRVSVYQAQTHPNITGSSPGASHLLDRGVTALSATWPQPLVVTLLLSRQAAAFDRELQNSSHQVCPVTLISSQECIQVTFSKPAPGDSGCFQRGPRGPQKTCISTAPGHAPVPPTNTPKCLTSWGWSSWPAHVTRTARPHAPGL